MLFSPREVSPTPAFDRILPDHIDLGIRKESAKGFKNKLPLLVTVGTIWFLTSACGVKPDQLQPDKLSGNLDLFKLLFSWIDVIGLGVLFGATNGIGALKNGLDRWKQERARSSDSRQEQAQSLLGAAKVIDDIVAGKNKTDGPRFPRIGGADRNNQSEGVNMVLKLLSRQATNQAEAVFNGLSPLDIAKYVVKETVEGLFAGITCGVAYRSAKNTVESGTNIIDTLCLSYLALDFSWKAIKK